MSMIEGDVPFSMIGRPLMVIPFFSAASRAPVTGPNPKAPDLVSHPSTQNSRCAATAATRRGQHASLALGQQDDRPRSCCAPCLCAMHPHQPSRAVGRSSENKSTLRKKLHRCVDADECEAPMRDQAETKLPPPTESLFLRHSTLDEQCFSGVVIKNVLGLLYIPIPYCVWG